MLPLDKADFGIYSPVSSLERLWVDCGHDKTVFKFRVTKRHSRVGIANQRATTVVRICPNVSRDGKPSHFNELSAIRRLVSNRPTVIDTGRSIQPQVDLGTSKEMRP